MTDQPTPRRRPLTNPQPEMTLDEVAKEMSVSAERIKQIEQRALHKLRRQLTKRGLNPETLF